MRALQQSVIEVRVTLTAYYVKRQKWNNWNHIKRLVQQGHAINSDLLSSNGCHSNANVWQAHSQGLSPVSRETLGTMLNAWSQFEFSTSARKPDIRFSILPSFNNSLVSLS